MFDRHVKERPIVSMAGMNGGLASYIFYSSAETGSYEIARSLRFNKDDSAYLSKTRVLGLIVLVVLFYLGLKVMVIIRSLLLRFGLKS